MISGNIEKFLSPVRTISGKVSHTLGAAVVIGEALDAEAIKAAVEAQDYPVTSIS